MSNNRVVNKTRNYAEEICENLDFELVDVEYLKEHGDFFLRIYIDKPGGINLDDCQKMSERLSEILDEEDFIKDSYYLEVSSPGLDRPLKTDKDLKRNLNRDIEVRLYKALDNKKALVGKLESFNDDEIHIVENEETIKIPREIISLIRPAIKF